MSDLSQVFRMDDISTVWLAISGIISVKTSPVSLLIRQLAPQIA